MGETTAESEPDTKGCSERTVIQTQPLVSYRCHVDGRSCEVVEMFADRLAGKIDAEAIPRALEVLRPHLPCGACRHPREHAEVFQRNFFGR